MAKVFISYAHENAAWKDRIKSTLALLKADSIWVDDALRTGDQWRGAIEAAMEQADLAVLIVSEAFLKSDYIRDHELPVLEERWNTHRNSFRVLPLLVEPCPFWTVEFLKLLQRRPADERAFNELSQAEVQRELTELAREISSFISPRVEILRPAELNSGAALPAFESGGARVPTLEVELRHHRRTIYTAEIAYTDPDAPGEADFSYKARLPANLLEPRVASPAEYGKRLMNRLFPTGHPRVVLKRWLGRADATTVRLRVNVEPSASDLHAMHWELLSWGIAAESPQIAENLRVSRFASASREVWPSADIRSRTEFTVGLYALDAPDDTTGREFLQGHDAALAQQGLSTSGPVATTSSLPYETERCTVAILSIRPVQGSERYEFQVACQDDKGRPAYLSSEELLGAIRTAPGCPQLLILDSPDVFHEGKAGEDACACVFALASELIASGVCGVLCLQAPIEQQAWLRFVTDFLGHLNHSGNCDQAIHDARHELAPDAAWKPVLFTRLRTGKVWYQPRFVRGGPAIFETLSSYIDTGRCIPVLGPGVSEQFIRSRSAVAERWARQCQYPLRAAERGNLRKVAQFIGTMNGRGTAILQFEAAIRDYVRPLFGPETEQATFKQLSAWAWERIAEDPRNPYSLLAELEAPVYLTTVFHSVLSMALSAYGQRGSNDGHRVRDRVFSTKAGIVHNEADADDGEFLLDQVSPLVYYLFGRLDECESIVLTEDDHFDFLLRFPENWRSMPEGVRTHFSSSTLLFLGFSLESWDFRTIVQAFIKGLEGSQQLQQRPHVAVQIDPDDDQIKDPERARDYLVKYLQDVSSNTDVFLGSVEDFLEQLAQHRAQRVAAMDGVAAGASVR